MSAVGRNSEIRTDNSTLTKFGCKQREDDVEAKGEIFTFSAFQNETLQCSRGNGTYFTGVALLCVFYIIDRI